MFSLVSLSRCRFKVRVPRSLRPVRVAAACCPSDPDLYGDPGFLPTVQRYALEWPHHQQEPLMLRQWKTDGCVFCIFFCFICIFTIQWRSHWDFHIRAWTHPLVSRVWHRMLPQDQLTRKGIFPFRFRKIGINCFSRKLNPGGSTNWKRTAMNKSPWPECQCGVFVI